MSKVSTSKKKLTLGSGYTAKELADLVRKNIHEIVDALAMEYDCTPGVAVTDPIFLALKQVDFIETELQGLLESYVELEAAKGAQGSNEMPS